MGATLKALKAVWFLEHHREMDFCPNLLILWVPYADAVEP